MILHRPCSTWIPFVKDPVYLPREDGTCYNCGRTDEEHPVREVGVHDGRVE